MKFIMKREHAVLAGCLCESCLSEWPLNLSDETHGMAN